MKSKYIIKIKDIDNVAVAIHDLEAGTEVLPGLTGDGGPGRSPDVGGKVCGIP